MFVRKKITLRMLACHLLVGSLAMTASVKATPVEEELQRLRFQLSQLQSQESQLSRDLYDVERLIADRSRDADQVGRDLDSQQRELQRAFDELRRADQDVQRAERALEQARAQRERDIREASDRVSRVQSDVSRQQAQVSQLQGLVNQLNSQRDESRQRQLAQDISRLERDQQARTDAAYANDAKIRELQTANPCNESCQIVLQSLLDNRARGEREAAAIGAQIPPLRSEYQRLEAYQRQYNQKSSELSQAQSSLASLSAQLGQAQRELSDLQRRPIAEEGQLAMARSHRDSIQSGISGLQRRVEQLSSRMESIRRDLGSLQSQQSSLQGQLFSVRSSIGVIERRIAELESGARRLLLVGSISSPSVMAQVQGLSGQAVSVEVAANLRQLEVEKNSSAVLMMDSVRADRLTAIHVQALVNFVRNGNSLQIIGEVQPLADLSMGPALLSLCRSSQGQGTHLQATCRL